MKIIVYIIIPLIIGVATGYFLGYRTGFQTGANEYGVEMPKDVRDADTGIKNFNQIQQQTNSQAQPNVQPPFSDTTNIPTTSTQPKTPSMAEPSIVVLKPGEGETLRAGSEFTIRWRTDDLKTKMATVSLELRDKYGWVVQTIASQAPNTGSYMWKIPLDVTKKTAETNNGGPFTIFAVSDDEGGFRTSDYSEHFEIVK